MTRFSPSLSTALHFADCNVAGECSTWQVEPPPLTVARIEVKIQNVRALEKAPTLADEGFAFVAHPAGAAAWDDAAWVSSVYVQSCLDLVKQLTEARSVVRIFEPISWGTNPDPARKSADANMIHLDQPRTEYRYYAEQAAKAAGLELGRAAIFNVWKATSRPPQDFPLAICDRRTISQDDYVPGVLLEGDLSMPSVAIAYSAEARPQWYYAPDMTADESLVFISADFDPARPLGCAHTGFAAPVEHGPYVPRTSLEVRVLALFQ